MLIEIIHHLPPRDRKIAKLVCRHWADACNDIRFLRKEKLVLCGIYGLDKILEVLKCSRRTMLNFDFHNVNFTGYETQFWQQRGHNIRELKFVDCVFDDSTMKDIFLCCNQLLNLSLNHRVEQYHTPSKPLISKSVIDKVLEKSKVKSNLKSLHIEVPTCSYLNNYIFWGIFTAFPSITEVEFSCDRLDDSFQSLCLDDEELHSVDKLSFASFLNKLQLSASSIEKLDFQLNRFTTFTTEAIAKVKNLTRYSTCLNNWVLNLFLFLELIF